jgi:hypothetical protein
MMPKAEGNYKILLGIAKAAINYKGDKVFEAIKNNSVVAMFEVIDSDNRVDLDSLCNILVDGMGSNEFTLSFKVFTSTFDMHFSAADIQTIKRYAM